MTALAEDLEHAGRAEPHSSPAWNRSGRPSTASRTSRRAWSGSRTTTPSPGAGSPARSWAKCSSKTEPNPSISGQNGFSLRCADVGGQAQPLPTRGFFVHRRLIVSLAVVAAVVAAPAPASASQTIARNATHVRLAVNKNRVALLTYRSEGRLHHTLAWGAINARTPRRGLRQVSFRLDYSGGWGSRRKDLWRGFRNACGPYQGPALNYVVAACTAPDGSHWVVQKWRRLLPPFGMRPTFAQRAVELQLSHFSGDLPEFVVKVDWVYRQLRPPVRLAQVQGQGRLRVQRVEVRLAARQVGPERLRRHVRLALRPRLEARERFPDASLERRLLLRLLPARQPPGRQGS